MSDNPSDPRPDPRSEPASFPGETIGDTAVATRVATLQDRLARIRPTLSEGVRLIAVSKTRPIEDIRAAYGAGIRDFGENRVQEAIEKQALLLDLPDITWHLIGPLQSNKARKALEYFDWIQSVDTPKLVERLNQVSEGLDRTVFCLLQVKLRPDANKIGWEPADLIAYLPRIAQLEKIHIRGLMAIAPQGIGEDETRAVFCETARLADRIAAIVQQENWSNIRMDQLSMGMSGDYHLAIEGRTTMVRLGQTLFGNRGV
jgi:PLP dependent protein